MKTLADRVRERMTLIQGMNQPTLAKRCGVAQKQISDLLSEKTKNPTYIYELSLALVTSVQWLKTGVEDRPIEFMLQWKPFIDAYEAAPENIKNSISLQLGTGAELKKSSPRSLPDSNQSHKRHQ